MTTSSMGTAPVNDSELVAQTLAGDGDAFGQIVARYQSLLCSLAYSATGNLPRSEDLAQETFVVAWRQLARLREPEKLRAWLCRIARNLICDAIHQDQREPSHRAEPLAQAAESHAPDPLPIDRTISNEEQAILWRSIERIPEVYREPLVLFYREHQSIEAVAWHLELTEDAVRQRLSRGRKMLHEEVLAFVEGALERTNPGPAFTAGVLSALPIGTLSLKAGSVGAVLKGGSGTNAAIGGSLGAALGALSAFLPNYVLYRLTLAGAHSDQERASIKRFFGTAALITVGLFVPIAGLELALIPRQSDLSFWVVLYARTFVVVFLPTLFLTLAAGQRRLRCYLSRIVDAEFAGNLPPPAFEYRSHRSLLGLPLVHVCLGDRFALFRKPVMAWIAIGQSARGGLFACGVSAIAPISMGGISLGVLSFGALSFGLIAGGPIATAVWPMFGLWLIGWQAFDGGLVVGWDAAVGQFALARDYALGQFAAAAHANNDVARQVIAANPFFRAAEFLNQHWVWMNLFWMAPFCAVWRIQARHWKPRPTTPP